MIPSGARRNLGERPFSGDSASPDERLNTESPRPSNRRLARLQEAEEDRALIARAQQGDMSAFRCLVERHQRRAFAVALSMVHDEHDAREIVQEAFVRVFKGLATFAGDSSFFTWLYRITKNLCIDLLRRPGRKYVEVEDTREEVDEAQESDFPMLGRIDGSDPADAVRRREIGVRLEAALDALPSYHRTVILLREVEGLSYDEIAESMGVSKGTIMSRLFHARQKLQRTLADCYREQVGSLPVEGRTNRSNDGEDS